MKLIFMYLVIINALSFLLMLIDKQNARKRKRRIPEIALFCVTAIGGSFGTLMSMYIFKHKTRHLSFKAGVPFLLFVHFFVILWLLSR